MSNNKDFNVKNGITVEGGNITLNGTGRIQGIDTVSAGTDAASKTYVDTAISNLVDSAPAALDTLNELAAALGDDANFSTTITNVLATKAPLASPALTGTPTAPTAAVGTNTTQLATTAFVNAEIANDAPTKTGTGASGTWGISITGNAATVTNGLYTTTNFGGDVSGTYNAIVVADDSHNHAFNNLTAKTSGTGTYTTSGDFRAPIFYDSNNTGYYVDPASTSNLNALNVGGYTVDPITSAWYTTSTFVYDATNGTRYYYIKLGTLTSSGGAIIEYTAKDDVNYPAGVRGQIFAGRYVSNSTSIQHDTFGPDPFGVQVYLDNSNQVWIRIPGCDWSHYFTWRFIWVLNFTITTDGTKQETQPTNSYLISPGQALRFGDSAAASGPVNTYSYDQYTNRLYARADFRAPIFYDSDNTAFYFDGASTTNINALSGNGKDIFATNDSYLRINQASTFTSGIWLGSSHLLGSSGYFGWGSNGSTTTSRVWINSGTYNGSNVISIDGSNGIGTAAGSWRAPAFYDTDNTSYYVDPTSTSVLNNIQYGITPTSANGGKLLIGSGSPYSVQQQFGTDNTGWRYGIAKNAGGTVTTLFYVQDGGQVWAQANMQAPIFYDSDNTAYFLDAAGNSVFSAFNVGGGEVYVYGSATNALGIRTGAGGAYKYFNFDASGNFHTQNGSVYSYTFYDKDNTAYYADPTGTSNLSGLKVWHEGTGVYTSFNNGNEINTYTAAGAVTTMYLNYRSGSGDVSLARNGFIAYQSGIGIASASLRAPIFYDSDNTAYYADPTGTSVFNALTVNGSPVMRGVGGTTWTNVNWNTLGDNQNTIYEINQEAFNLGAGSGNSNYPTTASYKYGTLVNFGANNSARAQMYISHAGNDLIFRGGWGTSSWQTWNKVLTDQNYQTYGNFGSYGVTAAAMTIISTAPSLTIRDSDSDSATSVGYISLQDNGSAERGWMGYGTSGNRNLTLRNTLGIIQLYGSYALSETSHRSPLFYDSDNTGYYVDPASTTNLNALQLQGAITTINGYTPTGYAIRLTPNLHLNAVAGNAVILNWDNGTTSGQTLRIGNGASSDVFYIYASGATYAPIVYDISNSAYYIDPASTSVLNALKVNTVYNEVISTSSLASGTWYTIAINGGNRAHGRFTIIDRTSGLHQAVTFYASHHYGVDGSNSITVLNNSFYAGSPITHIRILDGSTYQGAALQIYTGGSLTDVVVYLNDDYTSDGWGLVNFVNNNTDPGFGAATWAALGERTRSYLSGDRQGLTSSYHGFGMGYDTNTKLFPGSAQSLRITNDYGYAEFGPQNSSFCHMTTDRPQFYFGQNIHANGVYYDYNDTGYYVDPASTSKLATIQNLVFTGVNSAAAQCIDLATNDNYASMRVIRNIASATYNDGMYIGYGNSNGGLTRLYGGGATGGEAIKYSTYMQESGSFRAPIFYDSDNTSYYTNPNGSSQVVEVEARTGGGFRTFKDGSASIVSQIYFANAGNTRAWNWQLDENNRGALWSYDGSGWSKSLTIAHRGAGVFLRNNAGADVLAFSTSNFGYSAAYKTLIIGDQAQTTVCIGVDPVGNASGSFNGGGSGVEVMFKNGVTFISPNSANNSYNSNLYLADGYIVSNGSVRSPIFYDSNNTAYYVDPASTTYTNQLQILGGNPVYPAQWTYGYHSSSDFVDGTLVVTNIDASVANGDSFVIEITGKTYDGSNPPVSVIAQGYLYNSTIIAYSGISIGGNFASYIKVFEEGGVLKFWWPRISYWNSFQVTVRAANNPTNNTISRNRVTSISNSTEPTGTKKVQINLAKNMRADVSATNSVDLRAPIFYDSNNTGYYVDPASTAGNAAYFAGGIHISGANVSGNGLILADDGDIVDMNDGYCSMRFSLGVRIRNGNRTGDPAYELNSVYGASSLENQRGFVINGNYTDGRYSTRLRKWDDGGGVPLYIQQTTSTAGSWSNVASFGSSNSRYAFHVDGIIYTGSDVRAPIFYDSDNTGYYINPNGTSAFSGKAIGVLQYTSTHGSGVYSGSVSNPPLQVYSEDGGTAMMSFHRSNAYAFNMGLDPDNYFRWGGWSTGSNRFVFDMGNGWGQAAASWRAPMFYDSNDTSYYIDPNSTGYSGVLRGNVLFGDYGAGIVGSYSSYRYQLVFAMGDSYKGSLDGTSVAGGYGLWYSHPNAGGVAANLSTHGLMNIVNGSWHASLAASTRAVDDMRAPIFYDLNDTGYYLDPNGTSNLYRTSTYLAGKYVTGDWADGFRNTPTQSYNFHGDVSSGGPSGTWWFYESMRHSNSANYWGTQIAWGWEDNANRLMQRNVTSNSFSGWVEYLNTSDRTFSGNLYMTGSIRSTASDIRAPIFYDQNDTTYYANPNSESVLNTLTLFGELNLSAGTNYVDHSGTITFRNQGNYVNSATLTTGGDFTASGNVTAYSDISLKKNIELITNPIEKINSINGVTFERIDTGVKGTGVIAQEIEKVLPEVVIEDENGIKSVAYGNIVGLLIEAIKEQQSQINALESKMEEILAKLK